MTEKSQALAQAAMKMGQKIYEAEQAAGGAAGSEETKAKSDEDVVDAEFSEVDDTK